MITLLRKMILLATMTLVFMVSCEEETTPDSPTAPAAWASVSAGSGHTVAITAEGTLWTWGSNFRGQLGDGTTSVRRLPVQIGTSTNWASVSAGAEHTVAIRTDGTLWAWGHNSHGQLGDGSIIGKDSPVQVGTSTNWASVSAGGEHTLAIRTDGTLWAWGRNASSQLGDGTTIDRLSPVQVGTATNWKSVAAGTGFLGVGHTAAIRTDGTLWAWGNNFYGQLGDGTDNERASPVQVGLGTNWASVSAGVSHTVATRTDGTLWAWGWNGLGQLGDGRGINAFSPVQIDTAATNWRSVAAGGGHTAAIRTDGTLWTWGWNYYGQLGDGTNTISRPLPMQVGTATNWASVSAGDVHSLAIKTDGTLWAWGDNENGQLGDGTTTDRSSPVQVTVQF